MEISTLLGLILCLVAIAGTMLIEGGNPMSLLNTPAAVIVFGGSIGALAVAYPLKLVMRLPTFIGQTFSASKENPKELIEMFIKLADQARQGGLLSLEEQVNRIENESIRKAVMLIVDGVDPAAVEDVMETDIAMLTERHKEGIEILKALGGFGPTMGIIGTVMGLINVLGNLSNPDDLGHSIATAFIATLYGVASANMVWLPMSNKLKHKHQEEVIARRLSIHGVLGVQAGENIRVLREKLELFLQPKLRSTEQKKGA